MRRGRIPAWIWGAILCFMAPVAFCQSLSGSLVAGTVLSDKPSQGGNTIGPVGARSEVSALADRTIHAEARVSVNDTETGALGVRSGAGATGRGRQNFRIDGSSLPNARLKLAVDGRLESGRDPGLLRKHLLPDQEKKKMLGNVGPLPAAINMRPAPRQKPLRTKENQEDQKWVAREISTRRHESAVLPDSAYSADFPDSTRGTALLSPPDSGTASPLDWSPGMTLGFRDFTTRQFLNPSLHIAQSVTGRRSQTARRKMPSANNQFRRYFNLPSFSTSMNDGLRTRVSDPLDELNSQSRQRGFQQ